MIRNQIKIVSNCYSNTLVFYNKSQGKWLVVPNSSRLSRKEFTTSSIKTRASDIIFEINSAYNMCNRGVDIYFEGPEEEYQVLSHTIQKQFSECNLCCIAQKKFIAVAGKVGCGKTILIEEMGKLKGLSYQCSIENGINTYKDPSNTTVWCEIPGIDIGVENVIAARNIFESLAKQGLTTFIYCLGTSKIESLEEEFIAFVKDSCPSVRILLVLTQFVEENSAAYVEQLSAKLNNIKVIPVLAKEIKIRNGVIQPYGLDEIDHFIFEGK